ncbi:2-isopropylmalate synthase [Pararobbsia alpina]|uniref:2-isopropylmalate synthase n=1 Tax=Pararobbsia alpina TaxID=621374 RepID=UPI0039A76293
MITNPSTKYRPFPAVALHSRRWPSRTITQAPIWMSTDLRDGNQSLIDPMSIETKIEFFEMLVKIGFKQIEVGFPSASQTEFDFIRRLIVEKRIPDDVTIEVLTQSRTDLIERTFESLEGVPRAIVHLYNAIAPSFRKIVFSMSKDEVKALAVEGTRTIKRCAAERPDTEWTYQYSPETFSMTELSFAREVVDAVSGIWRPTPTHKMIVNLPATVEAAMPNVFADQVEWMDRNIAFRDSIVLSVHPHNDRGTAVAAAEMAILAGADRIEGCLFGNGERTGNVDIVTLAMNLYTQGISPGLDFSDIDAVRRTVERCNKLPVHPRHPYAGDLVYTAFSGSHQDAIRKGFAAQKADEIWEVPYLPIDPADVGRSYDAVIRVNSQSGKGGTTYLLERGIGATPPRRMQIEFSRIVQERADETGIEVTPQGICDLFRQTYFDAKGPVERVAPNTVRFLGVDTPTTGATDVTGIAAVIAKAIGQAVSVVDIEEQRTADGKTAVFVGVRIGGTRGTKHGDQGRDESGVHRYGAAIRDSREMAVVDAVVCAVNRGARAAMSAEPALVAA